MEKNRPYLGGFLYILTKNRPRVVGEPHDPNFRSVCYSAIFSIESQAKICYNIDKPKKWGDIGYD